jgi:hypothetical protein
MAAVAIETGKLPLHGAEYGFAVMLSQIIFRVDVVVGHLLDPRHFWSIRDLIEELNFKDPSSA